MTSFEMPVFDVPFEARLNPNVDRARAHGMTWARDMAMFGPQLGARGGTIWDSDRFRSMDLGLFASLCVPAAPPELLDLITEWTVWGFFLDDFFLDAFKRTRDFASAKVFVERLPAFMTAGDLPAATPTNPIEAGLADLWARTVRALSPAQRKLFAAAIRECTESPLWELHNLIQGRLTDPIDHVEMRRQTSFAAFTTAFVRLGIGSRLPDKVFGTRAVGTLTDTFADVLGLANDIISYEQEIHREGEINNLVLITQDFLGCELQRAVDIVHDLVRQRVQQFQRVAATEVPAMAADLGLDAAQNKQLSQYVDALRTCAGGAMHWMRDNPRYADPVLPVVSLPKAPEPVAAPRFPVASNPVAGRSGALGRVWADSHTHVPYQQVGPTPMPDIHMPYRLQLSPHLDASRAASVAWAGEMGFYEPVPGALAVPLWTEEENWGFDFAICAAGIDPDATRAELDLASEWLTWGTYADDYYPVVFGRNRNFGGAVAQNKRLSLFMPLDGEQKMAPANPLEKALADLWVRTAGPMPERNRELFREAVESMVESWLWELQNQLQHRVPDPVDYIEMRRRTFGSDLTIALSRLSPDNAIPAEVFGSTPMRELEQAAQDQACFLNDLFSYQKEMQFEGELHNMVIVVQDFLNTDRDHAVTIVNDLMTLRIKEFQRVADEELPVVADDHDLDEKARAGLRKHVEELQDWMAAILNWHLVTSRYREDVLKAKYLPTADLLWAKPSGLKPSGLNHSGLGTSATRIATFAGMES